MSDGGGATGWWSWIFLFLLLGGATLLAVVLFQVLGAPRPDADRRRDRREPRRERRRLSAREILDERYARGELDAAEYDDRRRRLSGLTGGDAE
jgi:putative membrane protein